MVFHVLGVMQGLKEPAAEPEASTHPSAVGDMAETEVAPEADDQAADDSED